MLGNDIRRLGAVNLNLVTMSLAWLPSAHHLLLLHVTTTSISCMGTWSDCEQASGGDALLHHHAAQESGRDRWSAWGRNVTKAAVVITPSPPPTRETPSPFLNPPRSPCQIVREIAGRLHEEVKVNL